MDPKSDLLQVALEWLGTRGLLGARELALMKPGALLVNTARGEVIDEDTLIKLIEAGEIGGAQRPAEVLGVADPHPPVGDVDVYQQVGERDGTLFILANDTHENFRLATAPLRRPGLSRSRLHGYQSQ
mgnify:CR=1 FL=1